MPRFKLHDILTGSIPGATSAPSYYIATKQRPSQIGRDFVKLKGRPSYYLNRSFATEAARELINGGIINIEGIMKVDTTGWTFFPFDFPSDTPHEYPDAGSW